QGGLSVVLVTHLLGAADFAVVSGAWPGARLGMVRQAEGLPPAVAGRAAWWERHVVELLTGVAPDAVPGSVVRAEYDPASVSLRMREMAKARELRAAGERVSLSTVQRMRRRYERAGIAGLVDGRLAPQAGPPGGQADPRVVEAVRDVMAAAAGSSTVTRSVLMRQAERLLRERHGAGAPPMPSRATFYRLAASLDAGRVTFGSARTRRSLAGRPAGPHAVAGALRPGELMEIDSTPLDVLVVLDDGSADRAELTGLVDVATRTIAAVVLRPSTKAVDAALLLARALTPQPLRPGWPDALRMARSVLPYPAMLGADERLAAAAAQPVIAPETIVCDRGKVYVSAAFRSACQSLGISLQPAHPRTPTDKPVIERTLGSVSTLFAQHVAGYAGRSAEFRGADVAGQAAWPVTALQDLLEEWVTACWQHRPHEGLRDPLSPGVALSPNEKYAALVAVAGYVPVALSADEYVELLPACWRAIGATGIRISHRSYDGPGLGPLRGQRSGVAGQGHRWEVHYDPYDVTRVWVRDHWNGGWIQAAWRHLSAAPAPFAEEAWRHAREVLARRGDDPATETEIARAVTALLDRAAAGPEAAGLPLPAGSAAVRAAARRKDRKVAARARASAPDRRAAPAGMAPAGAAPGAAASAGGPAAAGLPGAGSSPPGSAEPGPAGAGARPREEFPAAVVVPLEIFDARKEARRRW
ncbi:MAG TPA: Mu transposase C-terminal domain-containing protein, partial [Streptosporangiaceae bacterium]|nr:Mu transposase C-terminal domain-containing protein [Streptosporangiaceae bacterium]